MVVEPTYFPCVLPLYVTSCLPSAFKKKKKNNKLIPGLNLNEMLMLPFELLLSGSCFLFYFMDRESGEPSKRKSYLPHNKQFLITRNGN